MKRILSYGIILFIMLFLAIKLYVIALQNTSTPVSVSPIDNNLNGCVALNYHRIRKPTFWNKTIQYVTQNKEITTYNVYADEFENEILFLKDNGAYFATHTELKTFKETNSYPDKCVWISFDDVEETVYNNAFPILLENEIPFTLFIIAGKVGTNNFENLQLSDWDELEEMKDSGLASFGAHTYDMHYLIENKAVFLHKGYEAEFKEDLIKSKETIEKNLNVTIDSIAYPYGETSDIITEIVREVGLKGAYLLHASPITSITNEYYQNRYLISKEVFNEIIKPWILSY